MRHFAFCLSLLMSLWVFQPAAVYAADNEGLTNKDLYEKVIDEFKSKASIWRPKIEASASKLFWSLATISLSWNLALCLLRKADIAEMFAEFVRFIMFTGFFWWLLINGPEFGSQIINSLMSLAGMASNFDAEMHPGNIYDIGAEFFKTIVDGSSALNIGKLVAAYTLAFIILIVLILIAANMLFLLCASWVLLYAGIFILGFGGSRWTSDMAINYFKTVLSIGLQLMTMALVVSIGHSILGDYMAQVNESFSLTDLGIVLALVIILFILALKLPSLVSGIISGASIGQSAGIGQMSAGAMVGGVVGAATGAGIAYSGAKSLSGGAVSKIGNLAGAMNSAGQDMAAGSGAFLGAGSGGGVAISFAEKMSNYAKSTAYHYGSRTVK